MSWIEVPPRSSLLLYRGVLSFRLEAREGPGSEPAQVHHAARRRGGGVAARGARAADDVAGSRVAEQWRVQRARAPAGRISPGSDREWPNRGAELGDRVSLG